VTGPGEGLAALGIDLPQAWLSASEFAGRRRSRSLAFVLGQIAPGNEGQVGADVTVEMARSLYRVATGNCLAQLKRDLSLDRARQVVNVTGYVRSAPDFGEQPGVVNWASELLVEVFGEAGRHARAAIGVTELPRRAPAETEPVVEVDGEPREVSA
jgi:enamine deaminase RidA (YjgF/YER057c/UK114 family)